VKIEDYRPTERFSDKARYFDCRPEYPEEIIAVLARDLGLKPAWTVADIGAGTGKLTGIFTAHGNRVFALEPNEFMLALLQKKLRDCGNLTVLQSPAEATGLPAASIDLIAVGQAYHWFDLPKTRIEFQRILKSPGYLFITANRPTYTNERLAARIGAIIERNYFKSEEKIQHTKNDYHEFFGRFQVTDGELVRTIHQEPGRVFDGIRSSSFCPDEDDPSFHTMRREFEKALAEAAVDGLIETRVETRLTYGRMK
jgi:ubiquinone/menaquinone biosynthesis C-methylase UbiE